MEEGLHHIKVTKTKNGGSKSVDDVVAVEAPLEINVQQADTDRPTAISVTMRTPGDDEALALGFLFTEGLLKDYSDVKAVKFDGDNIVKIYLENGVQVNLKTAERNFYTTSSCGVCGKASIEAIHTATSYEIKPMPRIGDEVLFSLKEKLGAHQSLFSATGGIHAAAIFSPDGRLELMHEDVGRHNALDKLIGECFKKGLLPLDNKVLLLSGRTSFELVQKATMAGIATIVSVGAPSSLAVELAKENSQTLIGFLKHGSYNQYA